jgi:hypothetical protein
VSLEIDADATAELRAELGKKPRGRSLTEYFGARSLAEASAPASIAGNREFGLA